MCAIASHDANTTVCLIVSFFRDCVTLHLMVGTSAACCASRPNAIVQAWGDASLSLAARSFARSLLTEMMSAAHISHLQQKQQQQQQRVVSSDGQGVGTVGGGSSCTWREHA